MAKVKVDAVTVGNAYDNFKKVFFPGDLSALGHQFWEFIGIALNSLVYIPEDAIWEFETELASRIRALASPHYEAIIKVMVIRGHKYKELTLKWKKTRK